MSEHEDRIACWQRGWTECLRNVYAMCEHTQDETVEERKSNEFQRGRYFEAKHIARAMGTVSEDMDVIQQSDSACRDALAELEEAVRELRVANEIEPDNSRICRAMAAARLVLKGEK